MHFLIYVPGIFLFFLNSFYLFAFLISVPGFPPRAFPPGIFALSRFSSLSLLMNIKSAEGSCFSSLMGRLRPPTDTILKVIVSRSYAEDILVRITMSMRKCRTWEPSNKRLFFGLRGDIEKKFFFRYEVSIWIWWLSSFEFKIYFPITKIIFFLFVNKIVFQNETFFVNIIFILKFLRFDSLPSFVTFFSIFSCL